MTRKKFRIIKKPVAPKKASYTGHNRSIDLMGTYDGAKISDFIEILQTYQHDHPDAYVEVDLDYGFCYYESDTPSARLKLSYVECADIAYQAAFRKHKIKINKYNTWCEENAEAIKKELELRAIEEQERVLKKITRLEKEAAKLKRKCIKNPKT